MEENELKREDKEEFDDVSLMELFLTLLKINTVTFGGGYTIVPIIRQAFVKEKHAMSDEEMLNYIALGQSGPGAMAINVSVLVGYRIKGIMGSLVSVLAAVLPCIMIITVVSLLYQQFGDNFYVSAALKGMNGAIAAIMILAVFDLAKSALNKHKAFSLFMIISAFVLAQFFNVNTIIVVIYCALAGIVASSVGGL